MGKKSLYAIIASKLREQIINGDLVAGTKLSQRMIADQYEVSKKTAYDALETLEAEGLVFSTPRSGTVVSNNAWLLLTGDCSPDWNNYVDKGYQMPSKEKIFKFMKDLSSYRKIHISGPRIGKEFGYSEAINKALPHVARRLSETNDLNQIDIKGLYSLRETLCARLSGYGINVTPDEVMITSGMTESLTILFNAFLNHGMTFIQDTPSMLNSIQTIRSSGANIIRIPLDDYGINTEILSKTLKNAAQPFLYVNPANQYPTGISFSKTRRDKVMSICSHAKIPVIENDMLRDFWMVKPHPLPMKAFDTGALIIYVGCTLGVNIGLKLSWIVAQRNIMCRLMDVKTQYDTNTNTFLQITVDELFKNGYYDEFLDNSRPMFLDTIETAYSIIETYLSELIQPLKKHYGYYIWITFINEINVMKIYEGCNDIMFLPGFFFDNADMHGLHLAPFADSAEHFEEAIRTIAELALRQLNETRSSLSD